MSNHRPKKRPVEEEYSGEDEYEDEGGGGDYRSVIRQMFGYNPNKYRGMDDDDSDMEVGFRCIEAEERRSASLQGLRKRKMRGNLPSLRRKRGENGKKERERGLR